MATRAEDVRKERQERYPLRLLISESDRFFLHYGSFLAFWAYFDLLVEVAIMKQLRLSPRQASIICAGPSFGAKIDILYSLLSRSWRNKAKIVSLRKAQTYAERNTFIHGFLFRSTDFNLVRREVKSKYTVRVKHLNSLAMSKHSEEFETLFREAQSALKISRDELRSYALSIRSDAKGYKVRARPRRGSRTSSQKANLK